MPHDISVPLTILDRPRPALPLVGMIGRKRSGKNTVAAVFAEFGFTEAAFADPLREVALALNPIVHVEYAGEEDVEVVRLVDAVELFGWDVAKERFPLVRETLQLLGTDGIRKLDDDFWVRQASARIDGRSTPLIVTDVRFPNEADAIRARGGYIVRVTRPDLPSDDLHESETALDDYPEDFTLHNVSDLGAIRSAARVLADHLT